jgi:4-hydroxybenzoate polyprenyltransferase
VITAAALLTLAALGVTFLLDHRVFLACLALVISVLLYDLGVKRVPIIGPLNMGLCRSLSLLMGSLAAAGGGDLSRPVIAAAVLVGLYVASITQLARSETKAEHAGTERWLPFIVLLSGGLVFARIAGLGTVLSWVGFVGAYLLALLAAFIVGLSLSSLISVGSQHEDRAILSIPSLIGLLVSTLIFLQAAFVLAAGYGRAGAVIGLVLLAVWPLSRIMSRQYYAS